MEKLVKFLPLSILLAFALKILLKESSVIDVSALVCLSVLSYRMLKIEENQELKQLKDKIDLQNTDIQKRFEELDALKGSIGAIKLGQSFRVAK